MEKVFVSLVLCVLVIYNVIENEGVTVGGYIPVAQKDYNDVKDLCSVAVGINNVQSGVANTTCELTVQEIDNPQYQVVAGINYKVHAKLCVSNPHECATKPSPDGCQFCNLDFFQGLDKTVEVNTIDCTA